MTVVSVAFAFNRTAYSWWWLFEYSLLLNDLILEPSLRFHPPTSHPILLHLALCPASLRMLPRVSYRSGAHWPSSNALVRHWIARETCRGTHPVKGRTAAPRKTRKAAENCPGRDQSTAGRPLKSRAVMQKETVSQTHRRKYWQRCATEPLRQWQAMKWPFSLKRCGKDYLPMPKSYR